MLLVSFCKEKGLKWRAVILRHSHPMSAPSTTVVRHPVPFFKFMAVCVSFFPTGVLCTAAADGRAMDGGGRTAQDEGRRGGAVDGVHGGLQERDDDRHRRWVRVFMGAFLSS